MTVVSKLEMLSDEVVKAVTDGDVAAVKRWLSGGGAAINDVVCHIFHSLET